MLFNFDVQANPGGAPQHCLRWKEGWEQKGEDGNSKRKNKRGNTCSSSTMCWGYWPPLHDIKPSLIHLKLLKTHHIICNPMWCRSIAKGKIDLRVESCFQSNKFYEQAKSSKLSSCPKAVGELLSSCPLSPSYRHWFLKAPTSKLGIEQYHQQVFYQTEFRVLTVYGIVFKKMFFLWVLDLNKKMYQIPCLGKQ